MKIEEVYSILPEDGETLLKIAREAVEETVKRVKVPEVRRIDPSLRRHAGVFVTINANGELRGCIGFVQAIYPLYVGTQKAAVYAATEDPRFPPVTEPELAGLEYEVTVLSDTEEIRINEKTNLDVLITRGSHGLEVTNGLYSGLLLPQVMEEFHLSPKEFLEQTCIKAGLGKNCWKDPNTRVYRFLGRVFPEPS
ncbi:MAG: AmmeMemoRadiSam system protein A [Thermoplasmataceae archaeon]